MAKASKAKGRRSARVRAIAASYYDARIAEARAGDRRVSGNASRELLEDFIASVDRNNRASHDARLPYKLSRYIADCIAALLAGQNVSRLSTSRSDKAPSVRSMIR